MRVRERSSFAAWLCLFAYLLTGGFGARGVVLCVGPDGHVAIEAAAPGSCDGCLSDAIPGGDGAPSRFEQLPVCPCDDVALPGAGVVLQRLEPGLRSGPELALPTAASPLSGRLASFGAQLRASDRAAEATRASRARPRSVVLLL